MQMKNPAHPGELIRDNIDEFGLSVSQAAKGLGVTRQQLHNVIAGHARNGCRLEKAIGSTADTWLRMQMNYDLAQIRKRATSIKVKRLEPKVA